MRDHYRTTYPALTGETVTQGHANACAKYGHATHTVNGTVQERCPRCGSFRDEAVRDEAKRYA